MAKEKIAAPISLYQYITQEEYITSGGTQLETTNESDATIASDYKNLLETTSSEVNWLCGGKIGWNTSSIEDYIDPITGDTQTAAHRQAYAKKATLLLAGHLVDRGMKWLRGSASTSIGSNFSISQNNPNEPDYINPAVMRMLNEAHLFTQLSISEIGSSKNCKGLKPLGDNIFAFPQQPLTWEEYMGIANTQIHDVLVPGKNITFDYEPNKPTITINSSGGDGKFGDGSLTNTQPKAVTENNFDDIDKIESIANQVTTNTTQVTDNKKIIDTNTTQIDVNSKQLTANTMQLQTNTAQIDTNTKEINNIGKFGDSSETETQERAVTKDNFDDIATIKDKVNAKKWFDITEFYVHYVWSVEDIGSIVEITAETTGNMTTLLQKGPTSYSAFYEQIDDAGKACKIFWDAEHTHSQVYTQTNTLLQVGAIVKKNISKFRIFTSRNIVTPINQFKGIFTTKAKELEFLALDDTVADNQFKNEKNVTSITLGKVSKIGKNAFQFAPLTEANIPLAVTIGDQAFQYAVLTKIIIPKATSIGQYAFNTSLIKTLHLPVATIIGVDAFESSPLTDLVLPEVITIKAGAFSSAPLTTLFLPKTTDIGEGSFSNAHLSALDLPEAITIAKTAFESSPLTTLTIPKAITIGESAFFNATLTTIEFPEATTIAANAFYTSVLTGTLTLPKVTIADDSSFNSATLHTLIAPLMTTVGVDAFKYSSLTTLTIPEIINIEDSAFQAAKLTELHISKAALICKLAFANSKLTVITLGSVTKIGTEAFGSSLLTTIGVGPKATEIDMKAFGKVVNLTSTHVHMPTLFNTKEKKDSIFSEDNWTNITFSWI